MSGRTVFSPAVDFIGRLLYTRNSRVSSVGTLIRSLFSWPGHTNYRTPAIIDQTRSWLRGMENEIRLVKYVQVRYIADINIFLFHFG